MDEVAPSAIATGFGVRAHLKVVPGGAVVQLAVNDTVPPPAPRLGGAAVAVQPEGTGTELTWIGGAVVTGAAHTAGSLARHARIVYVYCCACEPAFGGRVSLVLAPSTIGCPGGFRVHVKRTPDTGEAQLALRLTLPPAASNCSGCAVAVQPTGGPGSTLTTVKADGAH